MSAESVSRSADPGPGRRDYAALAERIAQCCRPQDPLARRLQVVVDEIWSALANTGVSWAGFYLADAGGDHLVLGPRRDKLACSPIGLHGACGQAFVGDRPLVVRDVRDLGEGYIACDPRDRSEVVVPFYYGQSRPSGVLDLDSFELAAFDDSDASGLTRVLEAAGLGRGPAGAGASHPAGD